MKLSFLLALAFISAFQLAATEQPQTFPLKGTWQFLEMPSTSNTSICCPFEKLTMKVNVSDPYSRQTMSGAFTFAPEFDSRCMKARFANYTSGLDIDLSNYRADGSSTVRYYLDGFIWDHLSMRIETSRSNESIINIQYTDYDTFRSPYDAKCVYSMVRVDDGRSIFEVLEGKGVWKICLMVLVAIIALGIACQKNVYKVTPMQVQEDDIQKYQAPQQFVQQTENIL